MRQRARSGLWGAGLGNDPVYPAPKHALYSTGSTGKRLNAETGLQVTPLKTGPLGGDAQIGAMISQAEIDALIFFIDPLSALPHDVDVKSLLRLATLYNTLLAVNEATATAVIETLARN